MPGFDRSPYTTAIFAPPPASFHTSFSGGTMRKSASLGAEKLGDMVSTDASPKAAITLRDSLNISPPFGI